MFDICSETEIVLNEVNIIGIMQGVIDKASMY